MRFSFAVILIAAITLTSGRTVLAPPMASPIGDVIPLGHLTQTETQPADLRTPEPGYRWVRETKPPLLPSGFGLVGSEPTFEALLSSSVKSLKASTPNRVPLPERQGEIRLIEGKSVVWQKGSQTRELHALQSDEEVRCLEFSSDFRWFAVFTNRGSFLYDTNTEKRTQLPSGSYLIFTPDWVASVWPQLWIYDGVTAPGQLRVPPSTVVKSIAPCGNDVCWTTQGLSGRKFWLRTELRFVQIDFARLKLTFPPNVEKSLRTLIENAWRPTEGKPNFCALLDLVPHSLAMYRSFFWKHYQTFGPLPNSLFTHPPLCHTDVSPNTAESLLAALDKELLIPDSEEGITPRSYWLEIAPLLPVLKKLPPARIRFWSDRIAQGIANSAAGASSYAAVTTSQLYHLILPTVAAWFGEQQEEIVEIVVDGGDIGISDARSTEATGPADLARRASSVAPSAGLREVTLQEFGGNTASSPGKLQYRVVSSVPHARFRENSYGFYEGEAEALTYSLDDGWSQAVDIGHDCPVSKKNWTLQARTQINTNLPVAAGFSQAMDGTARKAEGWIFSNVVGNENSEEDYVAWLEINDFQEPAPARIATAVDGEFLDAVEQGRVALVVTESHAGDQTDALVTIYGEQKIRTFTRDFPGGAQWTVFLVRPSKEVRDSATKRAIYPEKLAERLKLRRAHPERPQKTIHVAQGCWTAGRLGSKVLGIEDPNWILIVAQSATYPGIVESGLATLLDGALSGGTFEKARLRIKKFASARGVRYLFPDEPDYRSAFLKSAGGKLLEVRIRPKEVVQKSGESVR